MQCLFDLLGEPMLSMGIKLVLKYQGNAALAVDEDDRCFDGRCGGNRGHRGKTATVDMQVSDGRIQDILRLFVKSDEAPMSGPVTLRAQATIPPGDRAVLDQSGLARLPEATMTTIRQPCSPDTSCCARGSQRSPLFRSGCLGHPLRCMVPTICSRKGLISI